MRAPAGDLATAEPDSAGRRFDVARQHVEQGRLARTARADHRVDPACRDLERDIAHGDEPAEALRQLFGSQQNFRLSHQRRG